MYYIYVYAMSVMSLKKKVLKKKNAVGKIDILNSLCQHWLLSVIGINLESHKIMAIGQPQNHGYWTLVSHSAISTLSKTFYCLLLYMEVVLD